MPKSLRFDMANRMSAGGRGTNLGVRPLMGRLEGGFSASAIPRPGISRPRIGSSGSNATIITGSATRPSTPVVPGSESVIQDGGNTPPNISEISNMGALLLSMKQSMQETARKMERRMANVEQQQVKLTESVKELSQLLRNQQKDNFSIKGSTWEVRIMLVSINNNTILQQNDCLHYVQVPLREEAAKLFCLSLTREPSDTETHVSKLYIYKASTQNHANRESAKIRLDRRSESHGKVIR